ncbi:hypothetical protein [Microbispora bryophytorum]|uniref:hypothetical protein n=1 Tax=Microbispora bryophytorum TaxID=1460882 RepID=UPI0033D461E5
MAKASRERLTLMGKVAAATRFHGPDAPETIELRREHAAVSIEEYIRAVVADAPPLTETQRDRLANLLRGGDAR